MPVKCCNRVPALRRFREATGRIAKFGWGAALQVAERAVERGEAATSGIHRDGQDRDVTLCGIGPRVGRLTDAEAIEIGVEVASPEPLIDGTTPSVFGHTKSCRHCRDGQSILSLEPLVPHVGTSLASRSESSLSWRSRASTARTGATFSAGSRQPTGGGQLTVHNSAITTQRIATEIAAVSAIRTRRRDSTRSADQTLQGGANRRADGHTLNSRQTSAKPK